MARSSRRPDGTPTIAAVAQRAGVSVATVSRVMNANATVDPAMAVRVRAAADELNYSPSPLARSLVLGRTQTVAVLVPDLGNPTFHGMLQGVSRGAARAGYRVLVADSSEIASEEGALAGELRRRCDGLVLCAPRMPAAALADLLPALAPVVLLNRPEGEWKAPMVHADYAAGIGALAQHLYDLGHRRIAYVEGSLSSVSNRRRGERLEAFVAEHPDTTLHVLPGGVTFEAGERAVDAVLDAGVTGVLAFNDLLAVGLLSALAERGVRVPGEVSVTGFDDVPFASYATPPLTTAAVPVQQMGEQAWARLQALMSGAEPEPTCTVAPQLVVRRSTGPVPV